MQIKQVDLDNAAKKGIISHAQGSQLWQYWESQQRDVPNFSFSHVLYYLGGMIAIAAISFFIGTAWNAMQGWPLLSLSLLAFVFGLCFTHYFLNRQLRIPAGIMATFSLVIVPLAIYNVQFILGYAAPPAMHYAEFHRVINWYWLNMEIGTIIAGIILLYFYRLPFLIFPIAVMLWYMGMDLWPFLLHLKEFAFSKQAGFSMIYGVMMLAIAIIVDVIYSDDKNDYAFWLYIFSALSFWGGLSCYASIGELNKLIYGTINLIMIFVSAFLNRRVFAVFGVIGLLMYISYLAFSVFANSLGFTLALILIGIFIIFIGTAFARIENKINELMRPFVPKKFRD